MKVAMGRLAFIVLFLILGLQEKGYSISLHSYRTESLAIDAIQVIADNLAAAIKENQKTLANPLVVKITFWHTSFKNLKGQRSGGDAHELNGYDTIRKFSKFLDNFYRKHLSKPDTELKVKDEGYVAVGSSSYLNKHRNFITGSTFFKITALTSPLLAILLHQSFSSHMPPNELGASFVYEYFAPVTLGYIIPIITTALVRDFPHGHLGDKKGLRDAYKILFKRLEEHGITVPNHRSDLMKPMEWLELTAAQPMAELQKISTGNELLEEFQVLHKAIERIAEEVSLLNIQDQEFFLALKAKLPLQLKLKEKLRKQKWFEDNYSTFLLARYEFIKRVSEISVRENFPISGEKYLRDVRTIHTLGTNEIHPDDVLEIKANTNIPAIFLKEFLKIKLTLEHNILDFYSYRTTHPNDKLVLSISEFKVINEKSLVPSLLLQWSLSGEKEGSILMETSGKLEMPIQSADLNIALKNNPRLFEVFISTINSQVKEIVEKFQCEDHLNKDSEDVVIVEADYGNSSKRNTNSSSTY